MSWLSQFKPQQSLINPLLKKLSAIPGKVAEEVRLNMHYGESGQNLTTVGEAYRSHFLPQFEKSNATPDWEGHDMIRHVGLAGITETGEVWGSMVSRLKQEWIRSHPDQEPTLTDLKNVGHYRSQKIFQRELKTLEPEIAEATHALNKAIKKKPARTKPRPTIKGKAYEKNLRDFLARKKELNKLLALQTEYQNYLSAYPNLLEQDGYQHYRSELEATTQYPKHHLQPREVEAFTRERAEAGLKTLYEKVRAMHKAGQLVQAIPATGDPAVKAQYIRELEGQRIPKRWLDTELK